MSKNLIINKLNKCKPYQYNQNIKPFQDSTSKISTSTKTQESPLTHNLNPQFTFKATDFKNVFLPKPKAQQFFDNFNPNTDIIYQKSVLIRPKLLQRSLEFQLMNLFREQQNNQQIFMSKRLQFCQNQNQSPNINKIPTIENIEVRQSSYRYPEFIKTQYNQSKYTENKQQNQFREYFQNVPYDCRKYKLPRQKLSFKQNNVQNDMQKRCQTQTDQNSYEQFQRCVLGTYQSQQIQKDFQFDDYHFVREDQKKFKRLPLREYYANEQMNQQNLQNYKSVQKKTEINGVQLTKRQGNSSRLSFFRKQRQHHFRKSLLEDFNNNSKRTNFCSNQNKQNIKTNSKFIPSLAFNNLSQAAQRKLRNQYSERYLLNRKNYQQQHMQSNKVLLQPKTSSTYLNKETQTRIQSIRKQLRQIYQVKDKQKSKLKIMRDQQTYDNNNKNSLRRVGSICRF